MGDGADKVKDQAQKVMEGMKKMPRPPSGSGKLLVAGAGVLGLGYAMLNHGLYNVEAGHRAIIYNRLGGIGPDVMNEGTHFKIPWFQRPIIFDVRARPKKTSSKSGSRDLQMIDMTVRVLYRPDTLVLPEIYRRLGLDFDERVMPSIVNETMKTVVAQHNASELITQREQVSGLIRRNLIERAKEFNILVDDVSITHLQFGREYTAAIEAKQVAQQEAERGKFVVEQALQTKKSMIIKAQGEADAAKLLGEAVKNQPGYMEIRRIEAAREVADTISKSNNKVYANSDSLLFNSLGAAVAQKK
jgi:prohibitin 2